MIENGELVAVKANKFVQEYRVSLSMTEIRIVNYLIANINSPKYDKELYEFEFEINEFCKAIHPDSKQGDAYKRIKETIKKLADKSAWKEIEDPDNPGETYEALIRWIERPKISKKKGYIKLKLNEDLAPYLLRLEKSFIKSKFRYTVLAQSKYTIPLYELLKSWEVARKKKFELGELREYMDAIKKSQDNFAEFKRTALEPAVREINEITDLKISYETIKRGNKVTHIEFIINRKVEEKKTLKKTEPKEMTPEEVIEYDEMTKDVVQPNLLDTPGFVPEGLEVKTPAEIFVDRVSEAFENEFTHEQVEVLIDLGKEAAFGTVNFYDNMEVARNKKVEFYRDCYRKMKSKCRSKNQDVRYTYLEKVVRTQKESLEEHLEKENSKEVQTKKKNNKRGNERDYDMQDLEKKLLM